LDYYSLKKRAEAAARPGERAPEFVEILPGGMATARPECTIEVEDGSVAKMRIRLQGGDFPDVAALIGVFRECRP
jgi:endonuclease YncB( thermonuclease family)